MIVITAATTTAFEIAAGITGLAVAARAADVVSTPSWYEHVDMLSLIIGVLFMIVGWFFVRTLNDISRTSKETSKVLAQHGERISCLEGKHTNGNHNHVRRGDSNE